MTMDMDTRNARLKNCFKPVMDYKDISKMVLIMQTAVLQCKQKIQALILQYQSKYNFLWKDTRDDEIKEILDGDPVITEIEAIMRGYRELEEEVEAIVAVHRVGPMDVLTKEMKMGFLMEIKEWKLSLCRQMSEKYKGKSAEISKFIEESGKDLNTPLKDMNDIRFVMNVLDKIRDKFVDYDMAITPIEECYTFLNQQKYRVPDEESNRALTLRYNFKNLQQQALEVQIQICSVQEVNKKKMLEAVVKFKGDLLRYLQKYMSSGPMVEGLAPQNASDRLVLFQDEFDELYERYTTKGI
jgi:dynein heavy chain